MTSMPDSVETKLTLNTLVKDSKVGETTTFQPARWQLVKGVSHPFFVAFLTIFLAELGDKTQLATLLISAESQSPWIVFIGATLALIVTSLLGVLLGQWLASSFSPSVLKTVTGASLLFISVLLLWDVMHL